MHKLEALRSLFSEFHQWLKGSVGQLEDGNLPSSELESRSHALRDLFCEVRDLLVQEALSVGVKVPDELEGLGSLEELASSINKARRDTLRVRIESTLDRVLSLSHREEDVFVALNNVRDEAQSMLREDAAIESMEKIAAGNHPFQSLLLVVEQGGALEQETFRHAIEEVESAFGTAFAKAILQKRLLIGEVETPSFGSLELPAFASVPLAPYLQEDVAQEPTLTPESPAVEAETSLVLPPPPVFSEEPSAVVTEEDTEIESTSAVVAEPKTTDTFEELDAVPEEEPSPLSMLVEESDVPEEPEVGVSLSTLAQEPPTDELPVLSSEEIAPIEEEIAPAEEEERVDVSEEDVSSFSYEEGDSFDPLAGVSIPSIEALAVAAMNEVLVPTQTSELEMTLRAGSSNSWQTPPTTPPKTMSPSFLTPLPSSVSMQPGQVTSARTGGEGHAVHSPEVAGFTITRNESSPPDYVPESRGGGSSMSLDAYDSTMTRSKDPNDPSRLSPLTLWQEEVLRREEHGVSVIFGSSALGLEDLPDFIEIAVGAEHLYVLDQIYAPQRFLKQIRQIASRRDDGMTFILITQQTPWDSSWVRGALELTSQMSSSTHPLRVVFVADPPSTWSMIPSIQPLEQDGATMLSLQPWHDSALLDWLEGLDFPTEHKIRRSIRRVTGNWSFALKFFHRQMRQHPTQWARHLGSLKQVLESRELAQKALRIMGLTHKTTLSILHKLSLEEPATQEAMERAFAHAPPRLITRALLWAERLSLAQYENYFWTTNPLIARLLKALR
jgi:hypothetical protein